MFVALINRALQRGVRQPHIQSRLTACRRDGLRGTWLKSGVTEMLV